MAEPTLRAASPAVSASVQASAGSGKTWLLVTRLLRLLLAGVAPDRILAVTFTRKAAGEMRERLHARLREFAAADDDRLDTLLAQMDETPDPALRRRARALYESLLREPRPLRASTFHGFCQDLLRRFPLEAGLPPGFELLEGTGRLFEESWDALFAEASDFPETALATDLEHLFEACRSLESTRTSLYSFLHHRSDWWAYGEGRQDAAGHATRLLADMLGVDETDPIALFWTRTRPERLKEFAALLALHPNKGNDEHRTLIEATLTSGDRSAQAVAAIRAAFMTVQGTRRVRKESGVQEKKMGSEGQRRFLDLHAAVCEELESFQDRMARRATLALTSAWYRVGAHLLAHFQRIKRERRLVDFADLEWKACELLNHAEHAHWVQYKLDQRVEHLLVDEFQDTNPTQWRLLKPLLDELAAGDGGRSLFLVGDPKQSIYGFRRGNPALLEIATRAMERRLGAERFRLDQSWRSAPAILDFVNRVFAHPPLADRLPAFPAHASRHPSLWGRVELWPLVTEPEVLDDDPPPDVLRNPLERPRPLAEARCHYLEGRAIAARIRRLVDAATPVGDPADPRRLTYDDVYILLGTRTHLADYEAALRDSHVPYLSMDRGTLLHSIEIRDLEALLNVLMTPQDNLALAQVLRSPLFAVDDADLAELAQRAGDDWYERLLDAALELPSAHRLVRAARLLDRWRGLAGHIPIHDLLDRIYHEANLIARYESAFPTALRPRVRANLVRFIELALEVDAGRYPSLPHFLERLRRLRTLPDDAPDQAPPDSETGQRVRIMTIHAAKGLEAALVFLADSAHEPASRDAWEALVRWPAEADRPQRFLLAVPKAALDERSRGWLAERDAEQARESANLLYVAMTRAKQMLVITGCRPGKGTARGWYGSVAAALGTDPDAVDVPLEFESGVAPATAPAPPAAGPAPPPVDPRLLEPLAPPPVEREIAPSRGDDTLAEGTGSGRLRGVAMHRLLQFLGDGPAAEAAVAAAVERVAAELDLAPASPLLTECRDEALATLRAPELDWLFRPDPALRVHVETPVLYRDADGAQVFGIVDRLLVGADRVLLVDFKSHRVDSDATLAALCRHYQAQMALYRDGVARLWPERAVRTFLVFTHLRRAVEIAPGRPH